MFREIRRVGQKLSEEECIRILEQEKRAALSVHGEDGYPYTFPVNYFYDRDTNQVYIHCAQEGHKLDAIRADDRICFTTWDKGVKEEDGWGHYVNSVIFFGRAEIVTEREDILGIIRPFAMKYFPTVEEMEIDLWDNIDRVWMLRLSVDHMSGKNVYER